MPLIELYSKFGKVVTIDATKDVKDVYTVTRAAIFPKAHFVVGAPKSGKSMLCERVASRMNVRHIDIEELVAHNGLTNPSDEKIIDLLREYFLTNSVSHVSIENFPKNILQAKLYEKAFKVPEGVIYLECERDICQERIMEIDPKSIHYIKSTELSQKCHQFYNKITPILEHLKKSSKVVTVNGNQGKNHVVKDFIAATQPQILCLGGPNSELRSTILNDLTQNQGYFYLNIPELVKLESERQTKLGIEFSEKPHPGQDVPSRLYINLARKVIFSLHNYSKFVVNGFPLNSEHAEDFERHCCNFKGFVAASSPGDDLELDDGSQKVGLAHFFANRGQLFKFNAYDVEEFQETMGEKKSYSVVIGGQGAGKTTVSKYITDFFGFTLVDIPNIIEVLKTRLGGEEGPLEELPFPELVKELKVMLESQAAGSKLIFDSLPLASIDEVREVIDTLGSPSEVFYLNIPLETVEQKIMLKEEIEELSEEQKEEAAKGFEFTQALAQYFEERAQGTMTNMYELDARTSLASIREDIEYLLVPRIVLTRFISEAKDAANVIANSAVKHDALFIDVPQVLRSHVLQDDQFGREIIEFKNRQILTPEQLEEVNAYNPSAFPQLLVLNILKAYIKANRHPYQKFIILNGYPQSDWWRNKQGNSTLLFPRPIDEINGIENNLGPIRSVISITHDLEEFEQQFEYFELEKVEEEKPVKPDGEGEEGEEAEEAGAEEGQEGDEAKPKFIKEDYKWSDTNGNPATFPQYFKNYRPCPHTPVIDIQSDLEKQLDILIEQINTGDHPYHNENSYVQLRI
eukprot:CAMPEP_0114997996 /NCGR_PEP_ID=MMETSP0216-20121206/15233_1 /TAXON_ID=223996 /ORGANISM="Protocruzia adherens, Strain Boccale" /LENGTH=801 /DNA_ID=CAMNT_0002362487 /DNA_START=133 /DNA_END=2538 /DNA_ORIENTATION=-